MLVELTTVVGLGLGWEVEQRELPAHPEGSTGSTTVELPSSGVCLPEGLGQRLAECALPLSSVLLA